MVGHTEELLVGISPSVGEHVHVNALAWPLAHAIRSVRVDGSLQFVAIVPVKDHVKAREVDKKLND